MVLHSIQNPLPPHGEQCLSGILARLHFDMVYARHLQLQRFQMVIIIKPDLSYATRHFINTLRLTARDSDGARTPSTSQYLRVNPWSLSETSLEYIPDRYSLGPPTLYRIGTQLPVDGHGHSHSFVPSIRPDNGGLVCFSFFLSLDWFNSAKSSIGHSTGVQCGRIDGSMYRLGRNLLRASTQTDCFHI
ncbi:hypothetical protein BYT27DRAFT_6674655 [Phlegmacium glaucopus]|nr:hypothetical protein BYT27DRAFT_6674655 [Phlegmacium glaucopus]